MMDSTSACNNLTVSVVIIFHNSERFLDEAIHSVLAQTYSAWELLLVDDGSTDMSSAIARTFQQRYPEKIRYLEHVGHKNRGMSASRNHGIRMARGRYIALLDSDDVWLQEKLEREVAILEDHPDVGMVYGPSQYWSEWTGESGVQDFIDTVCVAPGTVVSPPAMFKLCYPLGDGSPPCPSSLIFRRSLAEQVGGFEEEFVGPLQLYEDQAFLAKVYLSARIFVAGECWTRYRLHPNSCCASVARAGESDAARLFFLEWFASYLRRHAVEYKEPRKAIKRALRQYRHPLLSALARRARRMVGRQRETRAMVALP
jgi:glycosyltransferase involved in cell wall biosynthesis